MVARSWASELCSLISWGLVKICRLWKGPAFCISTARTAPAPQVDAPYGLHLHRPITRKVLVTVGHHDPFSSPAFPPNLFSLVAARDERLHFES